MSDHELLEMAKDAFKDPDRFGESFNSITEYREGRLNIWNPLTDDGDAFRLAVKLNLLIEYFPDFESEMSDIRYSEDPQRAARRAVVNAAAKIGESLR